MSPSKRTDKPRKTSRRKRRAWAAPFIVTTALALPAACTVQSGPAPQGPTNQAAQPGQPSQTAPTRASPRSAGPASPTRPTGRTVNPPPPATNPNQSRGTAAQPSQPTGPAAQPTPNSTKPRIVSNPPPPQVKVLPNAPTSGGTVQTRKDGTCWFNYKAAKCPPKATCNPPPPRQVNCPPNSGK